MKRLWLGALVLVACADAPSVQVAPQDLGANESCAIDGMLLAVHHGPKSQLQRADGSRAHFCDTKEIFAELLDPVRRKRVLGVWFQPLDDHPWEAHVDGWVAADSLWLVVGSSRMGAMGPTLAPFVHRQGADAFVDEHGGDVVRFADVDAAMLERVQQQGVEMLGETQAE